MALDEKNGMDGYDDGGGIAGSGYGPCTGMIYTTCTMIYGLI